MTFVAGTVLSAADLNAIGGGLWTGTMSGSISSGSVTASQYTSMLMSTETANSGAFAVSFSGHAFSVSVAGYYRIDLQVGFDNTSTSGNRMAFLLKNYTATTLAGSSPSGYYIRAAKSAASSDSTAVAIGWSGYLTTTDQIMPGFRATTVTGIMGSQPDTELAITLIGS